MERTHLKGTPNDTKHVVWSEPLPLNEINAVGKALGGSVKLGATPKQMENEIQNYFARKATAVMSNVLGPQAPLYLAGSQLDQIMFWVPQSGDIGVGGASLVTTAASSSDSSRTMPLPPIRMTSSGVFHRNSRSSFCWR